MTQKTIIHWFRQDLRLSDNPAFSQAARDGHIYPIYILDDANAGEFKIGGAGRWWLHHALESLSNNLNGNLAIYKGDAKELIPQIIKDVKADGITWNRCYEPWRIARDKKIKADLEKQDFKVETFNGSLLWEPWNKQVLKKDGTPYRVFTPYFKNGCLKANAPRTALDTPHHYHLRRSHSNALALDELKLLPKRDWGDKLAEHWDISEDGAKKQLYNFLDRGLEEYKDGRNLPAKPYTSHLSPYLHWGLISPNQVWHAAQTRGDDKNIYTFCSELGWREFSYSLLYHFPKLTRDNLQDKFDKFPWRKNKQDLERWQKGQTGYPIIDAGMRQLWQTGIMHNRIRMVVGSFLVKNLMLHWHDGEDWFWDCLVDADLASNSVSWQWVAGCGADAAPFFRIFNPVTQGEKFDKHGDYTRKYVPELKDMPDKYLFKPWEAPDDVLEKANVKLGDNYPKPIVDLKSSRERALKAYKSL